MIQEINITLEKFLKLRINRKEYKVSVPNEKEFASQLDSILGDS